MTDGKKWKLDYNRAHLRSTKESLKFEYLDSSLKSELTNYLAISDHFPRIFFCHFFFTTPRTPLLHDDQGHGGEGVGGGCRGDEGDKGDEGD